MLISQYWGALSLMIYLCLGLLALLIFAPDLPLSRTLHRWLVEEPVRLLSQIDRTRLFFALILVLFATSGAEMILVLGSGEMVMAVAWQMAVYFDAVAVSITAMALAKVRPIAGWVTQRLSRLSWRRPRPRRSRLNGHARDADNDDDPGAQAWAA